VSSSSEVDGWIRRIREQGYHIYVVLDARIGVDRDRRKAYEAARKARGATAQKERDFRHRHVVYGSEERGEFRLNRGDVRFLEALGIDGTRQVRSPRRTDLLPD